MLYDDELLDLPVPLLAGDGCLVVVWATNNQHQHRFIQDDLFPRWGGPVPDTVALAQGLFRALGGGGGN